MKRVLVIAPHPDDEVLGVGGTIVNYIRNNIEVYICIVTRGFPPLFNENRTMLNREDAKKCHEFLGIKKTYFLDFPAAMLEKAERNELNNALLSIIKEINPTEVFIPHYGDMQKDHQIVSEACMVALRPKYGLSVRRILGYETLSETAWNTPNVQNDFIPNVFIDISDSLSTKKEALSYYSLQVHPFPDARSEEAIDALAKYRGALMNMMAAEAFMLIRELR